MYKDDLSAVELIYCSSGHETSSPIDIVSGVLMKN